MKPLRGLNGQLASYLQSHHEWHAKGTLTADMTWTRKQGRKYGTRYLPETVGRALRHLEEVSILAVKDDGISVQYKWIPHAMRPAYIPTVRRPLGLKQRLFNEVELATIKLRQS